MKAFWARPLVRTRYPLAIAAGLLLAASFPKIGIAGFAWIAPGLMLAAALGKSGGESFRIGYVAGLTQSLVSLYWLLLIPYRWHGIPLGPATGWLALSGFVALFPATWVWLLSQVRNAKGEVRRGQFTVQGSRFEVQGSSESFAPPEGLSGIPGRTWAGRTVWAISGAALWVGLEMILARIFGGFPWDLLGVSQYQLSPLIQIASVAGVYGVSYLVVWFSLSLVSAGVMMIRRPTLRSVWIGEMVLPLLAVAVVFHVGLRQVHQETPTGRSLKVTLIQPSIPQTLIWDSTRDEERFQDLIRLSEQALTNKPDLLIWPEAAVPKLLRYFDEMIQPITRLARDHHVWMIIGADDMEPRPGSTKPEDREFFNCSFLVSPEGKLVERYKKRNLVIFGEYIPLTRWFPFLKWFTPIEGGFTPGDRPGRFELKDLGVKTSVLICFEDVFPQLARRDVEDDTDFLVNLTNNGWFGESAAQWQHAATALFRAVENGVPLIRCSNNGLTCWVDAHGRRRDIFRDSRGTIYGPGFMTVEIPLAPRVETHAQTFYNRHGDWFGWGCVGIGGLMFARAIARALKRWSVE